MHPETYAHHVSVWQEARGQWRVTHSWLFKYKGLERRGHAGKSFKDEKRAQHHARYLRNFYNDTLDKGARVEKI